MTRFLGRLTLLAFHGPGWGRALKWIRRLPERHRPD